MLKRNERFGHWMLTIGNPNKRALRITRGRLGKRGKWHAWQPCIFWIVKGRRWYRNSTDELAQYRQRAVEQVLIDADIHDMKWTRP